MSTQTTAELQQILNFSNKNEVRTNEIRAQFSRWQAGALAYAANWKGEGGTANMNVINAMEGAVNEVVRYLNECSEAARTAHGNYVAGDTGQSDTFRTSMAQASSITSALA